MQVVIIEQPYTFVNKKLLHRWNVQLLGTARVVAQINENLNGTYQLQTRGNHPSGNRYRTFGSMEKVNEVVMKWAGRRFGKQGGVNDG